MYSGAPDLLLNTIAEANDKLNGNEKAPGYVFWKRVVKTMTFVLYYIEDLQFIHTENRRLRSYTNSLEQQLETYKKRLLQYVVLEELVERDELEESLRRIEARGKIVDQEVKDKIKEMRTIDQEDK